LGPAGVTKSKVGFGPCFLIFGQPKNLQRDNTKSEYSFRGIEQQGYNFYYFISAILYSRAGGWWGVDGPQGTTTSEIEIFSKIQ
jgi:hypothetical protein